MRVLFTLVWLTVATLSTDAQDAPSLPKIVLVGDSIRLGYASHVATQLSGKAVVVSPKPNGGDSSNVLKHLDEWVIREQPAIVHFNCGIHDTKQSKETGTFQVSPEQYEANLRQIVSRLRNETKATVIFATTTPILDDRAGELRKTATYALTDAATKQYNDIARKVMTELKVPVNDLRRVLPDAATTAELMTTDGVHFTAKGNEKLAAAVSERLLEHLPK
jgi:lysophospholipase L1-like esterase